DEYSITELFRPPADRRCGRGSQIGYRTKAACGAGLEPASGVTAVYRITDPLRPATNKSARIRTRTREVGARDALQLHQGLKATLRHVLTVGWESKTTEACRPLATRPKARSRAS